MQNTGAGSLTYKTQEQVFDEFCIAFLAFRAG